jgi:hypothetical protein
MSTLWPTVAVHNSDSAYVDAHRFMYGALGEHVATAALFFRDRLMRPGFVLPVIRLAPVAPYGKCLALSGNGGSLDHVDELAPGIWVYLHEQFFGSGQRLLAKADGTVLHELLHNELVQFGENPKHEGEPWARRCQELSDRLGLQVKIEARRSFRPDLPSGRKGSPTKGCRAGFLPYEELARWPAKLFNDGPSLRDRIQDEGRVWTTATVHNMPEGAAA